VSKKDATVARRIVAWEEPEEGFGERTFAGFSSFSLFAIMEMLEERVTTTGVGDMMRPNAATAESTRGMAIGSV